MKQDYGTGMNYIAEIKAFYDLALSKPLSTGQIALWHALMCINNKCAWAEWFAVPNQTLELLTGLSRQAISKNRNVMKQLGYLDFRTNGTKATSYTLNSLQESCQTRLQVGCRESCQDGFQNSGTLNKRNETRKEKIPSESKSKRFSKPTPEQIRAYCLERKNSIDPQQFYDFYEARGWVAGKTPMKDWKAAVRTWERRERPEIPGKRGYEGVREL
jgi:hypothetical protein